MYQKKKAYEARVKAEQERLGMREWRELEKKRANELEEYKRAKTLENLYKVATLTIQSNTATDISIENLGWFAMLSEREAKIVLNKNGQVLMCLRPIVNPSSKKTEFIIASLKQVPHS